MEAVLVSVLRLARFSIFELQWNYCTWYENRIVFKVLSGSNQRTHNLSDQLAQKKEAAEQLYENPYGRKFTSNEIRDILDREEKVRVLHSYVRI